MTDSQLEFLAQVWNLAVATRLNRFVYMDEDGLFMSKEGYKLRTCERRIMDIRSNGSILFYDGAFRP